MNDRGLKPSIEAILTHIEIQLRNFFLPVNILTFKAYFHVLKVNIIMALKSEYFPLVYQRQCSGLWARG